MPLFTASPLFTVVMPAFNAAGSIATSVASVLAQKERRFELIIVDDGSPDDTAETALRAAGGDQRVRLIRQANQGPAAARNRGVRAGSAPLLAFLDADDRWAPDTLRRHYIHFLARPALGVSFARIRFFDATLTEPGRVSAFVEAPELAVLLGENPVCTTSNLTARREVFDAVGGFDPALTHAEDQEWVARVLAISDWQVRGLDEFLVDYRMSANGLSADLRAMQAGWSAMMARIAALAPERAGAARAEATALFQRYLARRALRTDQGAGPALRHLLAALRHSPIALLTHQPVRTAMTAAGALALPFLRAIPGGAALVR
jgi:hypothetical protein